METPDLADLIWLFEDAPTPDHEDLTWPVGLHSFRLRRGSREVLFSLDPTSGEVYITLSESGEETASIGRIRSLERLTIEKRSDYEALIIHFNKEDLDSLTLQTRPTIHLTWNVMSLGTW